MSKWMNSKVMVAAALVLCVATPILLSRKEDDGGGNSEPSESVRTTNPMSHTPVKTKSTSSGAGCHLTKIRW